MITSAIYSGRTYIQGFVILLISCLIFSQDFSFGMVNRTETNSKLNTSDLAYTDTSITNSALKDLAYSYNSDNLEDILTISTVDSRTDYSISNELLTIENNSEDINYVASPIEVNLSSDIPESLITNTSYHPIKRILYHLWLCKPNNRKTFYFF